MKPAITIVTPSYQQAPFIRDTIESVLSQGCPDLEYIVIDGGSTDGTIGILAEYADRIRWISEPDRGQSDAVNKGFRMARGEILGWLNSDDTYTPGTIATVVEYFRRHPDVVMLYGEVDYVDRDGNKYKRYATEPFNLQRLAERFYICQPAVFIRAKVFEEIGPLDTDLHACMDNDYWMKIGKRYPASAIAWLKGRVFANFRMYEENKSSAMQDVMFREAMLILRKHFGSVHDHWQDVYINCVSVKPYLQGFEKRNPYLRAIARIWYVTKVFGIRRGFHSLRMSAAEFWQFLRWRFLVVSDKFIKR